MNKEFIIRIFLSNTQGSSFQRGYVYSGNATPQEKEKFQDDFRARLRALEERYAQPITEEDHYKTILEFAEQLSRSHGNALANRKLRIGIAQKAINLYLKFLWSFDFIPEPPHCPIDRIVLTEIGINKNWTELDSMEEYKSIIKTIKQCAGEKSLAQWEHDLWN